MNRTNLKIDEFLSKARQWRDETAKLRKIALDCQLTEEMKWGKPCYTFQEKNIVLIQGFKEYCALLFFKGALLKDAENILVKIGEHTQAGRQIRFTSIREIAKLQTVLKTYIHEAMEVEKAGSKVKLKKEPEPVPEELRSKLEEVPALKTAFAALTPGRQRAYILHISAAKQSKTRAARVEKYIPQILEGKGLND
jgi:uncharacterized protein YdeI (YjbR/CyaY-like superfamily)